MGDRYKRAYLAQKHGAAQRGIAWELTYEQWLEWWGDDIGNRGVKAWNLQMQRPHDAGPYALWNIIKGTPKRNGKTRGLRAATAAAERARTALEARLDAALWVESREPEEVEDESISGAYEREAALKNSMGLAGTFVRNK